MENTQTGKGRVRIVRGSSIAHIRQLRDERLARRTPPGPAIAAAAPLPDAPMTLSRETSRLMADHGIIARAEPAATPPAPETAATSEAEAVGPVAPATGEAAMPAAHPVAEAAPQTPVSAEQTGPVAEPEPSAAPPDAAAATEPVAAAAGALLPELAAPDPAAAIASAAPDEAAADVAGPVLAEPAADPTEASAVPAAEAPAAEPVPKPAAAPKPETESDLLALPGAGIGLVWLLGLCGISSLADLAKADTVRLETNLGLVGTLLDLEEWVRVAQQATATKRPGDTPAA